jgi:hypothetical protein
VVLDHTAVEIAQPVLCGLGALLYLIKEHSMGIRPERTIINLSFGEDTSLALFKIKVGCCTIREMNMMLSQGGEKATTGVEVVAANTQVEKLFLKYLVEWNLDGEDGQPLPMTEEGIETLEPAILTQFIVSWQTAMMAVPTIQKPTSSNGVPSEELLLGQATSSGSPGNWPTPSSS